jgi:hypothetical protein
MTQRPPRSIRLTAEDEKASMQAAEDEGLTWHGWVSQLIRNALKKKQRIQHIIEDQERTN